MGIVYSAKLASVPEHFLYTNENYFTGSLGPHFLDSELIGLYARVCAVLGRPNGRRLQSPLRRLSGYNWVHRSPRRCSRPELVRENFSRRSIWEHHGPFRIDRWVYPGATYGEA